ncbi:MAG: UDP-N-acetylglucosamine 1-carboxyvinyltransferase [Firmicutes bacterium]|nr:UDP-N-acetylglucosamine 1-carboxyvinyltransferase [Bacillota bacterium]
MGELIINGGRRINGEITIQGAKNAALPILAAAVMTDEECVIKNCPALRDVDKTVLVLKDLGCGVRREGSTLMINGQDMFDCKICESLMREMRSSIIFLGAILTRCKKASVSMPGGCPIGLRPIDLHLKALKKLGAQISEEHGYIKCSAPKLCGCDIYLDFPSVGATENILLASVCAEGTTVVSNAAREPEIVDLANFLNAMGAKITGAGGSVIRIDGVKRLHGAEYSVMSDRIAAATYLAAGAVTGGELTVRKANKNHMNAMLDALCDMGAELSYDGDAIHLKPIKRLKSIHTLRTMPYPGFPTDIQSPFMAAASLAKGTSVFVENIFENRFRHVDELVRMGADIKVSGRCAVVRGVKRLSGARVRARELRGGAALVIAGLAAEGQTIVENTEYIDRGYENMEKHLAACGADIRRNN